MKLLASDFDNTFFNGKDYNENIKYINKFVDEGNIFVIVTGRFINHLLEDIKDRGIKYSYLICNDGAIIFNKNLEVIYKKDITYETTKDIASLYEDSDFIDQWYIDTGFTITHKTNDASNGVIGHFTDNEKAQELLSFIKKNYPEAGGYLSQHWINVTEKTVSKGSSIKELISLIGIDDKNVYTIGDNINDISMSDYDFNSYCMSNSVEELKIKCTKYYDAVYELVLDLLKKTD